MSLFSSYCASHGIEYSLTSKCPECLREEAVELQKRLLDQQEESRRDSERRSEEYRDPQDDILAEQRRDSERRSREEAERHEEQIDAIRNAEYKRFNPGDYQCPGCNYKTLLRNAKRCPVCHETVTAQFWSNVIAQEKAAEELFRKEQIRKAEEWKRGQPERDRIAREKAKLAEQARLEKKRKQRLETLLGGIASLGGLIFIGWVGLSIHSSCVAPMFAPPKPKAKLSEVAPWDESLTGVFNSGGPGKPAPRYIVELPKISNNIEELQLVAQGTVGPGRDWVTPSIDLDYGLRFAIEQAGGVSHGITVHFTSVGGGWTNGEFVSADYSERLPVGITHGPLLIRAPAGETMNYNIRLYQARR